MMFDEVNKYKNNDHFFFNPTDLLQKKCNAPKDATGIYIIYRLAHGSVDMVYIGSSGKIKKSGISKTQVGSLYDGIVNSTQFGKQRASSWPQKMKKEQIDALDVYWFVTVDDDVNDNPSSVEDFLIQKFYDLYGRLPEWNGR